MAASRCASSTGFSMKSSAPALMAATAMGTSRMAGDQDHRQGKAAARELAHELDAIHAGHAHVGHDAARGRAGDLPEEGVGRVVGFDSVAEHAQHFAQRLAHRLLVVDDEDRGGGHAQEASST